MNNKEARKIILRSIIEAQIASDAAKGKFYNWPLRIRSYNRLVRDGYKAKTRLIDQAAKLIARFPESGIEYFYKKDESDIFSLIYFSFKIGNKKMQVSFHNPNDPGLKIPDSKDSYAVFWDGLVNGSRQACMEACREL